VRHAVQLVLALAAAAAAAWCWPRVSSLVDVAPVTEGQPATVSVVYSAPVLLVLVLVTAAGVLAVLGVAGWRRRRPRRRLDVYTP
jgi:hypothetical protein